MNRPRLPLPIDSHLPAVLTSLAQAPSLVLQAEPGTGKTTRVPPALLGAPWASGREVLVLEPRRLAAKMAARRVAEELGEQVGRTVGYQFRFENVGSRETRLRFLTEGMLMRRLLSDPELRGVAAVCLDEFHERHLHGDLALAMLKRLQARRPELRLLVMSATLETETVAGYLGAPVMSVPGKRYDVELQYAPPAGGRPLELAVRDAVARIVENPSDAPRDDVLVFLPGMAEIRRAEEALSELARRHQLAVLPLHGELTREEQDQAVGPSDRTKVILATNVAESSLTIPGITAVVDSGLARIASYSYWSGLPSLTTRAVSKASALQRAGRAGRTAPGRCIRLYAKGDYDGRAPYEVPEVLRADLSQTVLELHTLGVTRPGDLEWFERPGQGALEAAESLLAALGAIGAHGEITPLGRKLVEAPIHPRLARVVLEGASRGAGPEAARLAAFVSESRGSRLAGGQDLLQSFERSRLEGGAAKLAERLEAFAARHKTATVGAQKGQETLGRALLAGFPDRVASRRTGRSVDKREVELVLSSGGSAVAEESPLTASHEYFVAVDVDEKRGLGQSRSRVRATWIAAIEPDWLLDLDPSGIRETRALEWNASGRVESVERLSFGELVIDETRRPPREDQSLEAGKLLASRLLEPGVEEGIARLTEREAWQSLLKRLRFVARHASERGFPTLDESWLRAVVERFCDGKVSLKEAQSGGLLDFILLEIGPSASRDLERLAPATVQLARGRRVRVNYELDQPPWVESRLQDFFGMTRGPALLEGRMPLTLHLLAPNQRAVQVTADLAGFWERNYPALRKELGRRYPRHSWPENPLAG
jgi:ATP-dependent helicase HrpB